MRHGFLAAASTCLALVATSANADATYRCKNKNQSFSFVIPDQSTGRQGVVYINENSRRVAFMSSMNMEYGSNFVKGWITMNGQNTWFSINYSRNQVFFSSGHGGKEIAFCNAELTN